SLIATDPESGLSQRVEVELHALQKAKKQETTKTEPAPEPPTSEDNNIKQADAEPAEVNDPAADEVNGITGGQTHSNSLVASNSPNTSATTVLPNISNSIGFAQAGLSLVSGQSLILPVVTASNATPTATSYQCQLENIDQDAVSLQAGCKILAQAPGKAVITLTSDQYSIGRSSINIEVAPHMLELASVQNSTIALPDQVQQYWLQVNGVKAREFYQIQLTGLLPAEMQLFALPMLDGDRGTCFNTLPGVGHNIGCIVQAVNDQLYVMLHNPLAMAANGIQLSVQQISEPVAAFAYLSNTSTPQMLSLENKFSAYILANELGLDNRHYYEFSIPAGQNTGWRVNISEFNGTPGLEVFWSNGYCPTNKAIIEKQHVYCNIPADAEGAVNIIVSGNPFINNLQHAVAEEGGTNYSIWVSSINN
ncbi:MAG: hypothetical protein R3240_08995, partial [Gammaproteobacteria bacterium]|nr:hypothetical protein [Gammaproteobacteria bacterium]